MAEASRASLFLGPATGCLPNAYWAARALVPADFLIGAFCLGAGAAFFFRVTFFLALVDLITGFFAAVAAAF